MTPPETAMYRTAPGSTAKMPFLLPAGLFLPFASVVFFFCASVFDRSLVFFSRLRRAPPGGGRPDRFFSFDHFPTLLCPKHQAAGAIQKLGVVFVGGFNPRWGHLPRHYGIYF